MRMRFTPCLSPFRLQLPLVLVLLLSLAACGKGGDKPAAGAAPASAATAPSARSARPGAASAPVLLLAPEDLLTLRPATLASGPVITGSVQPERRADLRAEVAAVVLQVLKENGEAVRAGDLLMRLDDTSIRDSLTSSEESLRASNQAFDQSERQVQRLKTLQGQGMISMQGLEDAEVRRNNAQSDLAAAKARVVAARQQLRRTEVRAPFDGVVSERKASTGDTTQVGKELVKVIDPRSMRFEGLVSADRMSELKLGQRVSLRVNGYATSDFSGTVRRIDAAANATTRQVEVIVAFADPAAAPRVSGLFAEGRVETGSSQAITIAESAVVRAGDAASVWKLDGKALRKMPVKLGARDIRSGLLPVLEGLAPGDRVLRNPGSSFAGRAGLRTRRGDGGSAGARGVGSRDRRAVGGVRCRCHALSGNRKQERGSAMFLSEFSIKRPIAMIVIIIGLMALGMLALSKLRVNQFPDVEQPILTVSITYPGASPDTVERELINRIEKAMQGISGVTDVRSTASEGNARLTLFFEFNKNMIEAADEVRNAIGSVRHKLPTEMREPILQRLDPSAQPIMQLALSSTTLTHAAVSRLAEDQLADQFRGINGVATVNVNGSLRRELSVLLRAEKLREFEVSVTDVVNALRAQNATAPVGKVRGLLEDQSIRLVGRIESPAEFGQIVIKRRGSELVRLAQVATVQDGFAELSGFSVRSGNANVGLSVTRTREASTVSVANGVRKLAADINKTLPAGTKLEVTQDGGENAQNSLRNVVDALVFGAGLTIFVVYVFLNSWRSTLITALSLPTSVIAAFIAVWLCGFTLNFMSLLGLSLAIGVLIDDAIVVRENIVRHMELGEDRRTAALNGTAEIGLAVAATTFSIVAVFVPVAFMPGVSGEWFRPFAVTVVASVLVSLFISFTLDPMLSAYWGDAPGHHLLPKTGISRQLAKFNDWFDHQADRYGRIIAWALHHRRWMVAFALVSLVGAGLLQYKFGGSSFLPSGDAGLIAVDVRTPSSSSLEYARLKVEAAATLARGMKEAVATNSYVNPTGGRVYVDIGKSTKRKRSAKQVADELRGIVGRLVGAEYTVLDDLNNGAQKPVQIRFTGTDSRKLLEITNGFMDKLRQVPGAVDVGLSEQDPQAEMKIELDRGLANSLGISVSDAAQALRVAFAGVEVGDWVDPTGETRDVAVRLHPDDRVNAGNIERLPIAVSGSNRMVPLEQIATVTMGKGPSQIQHAGGKRTISVAANAYNRSSGEVTADAMKIARAIDYPPGFGLELAGASKDQQEVFTQMGIALVSGIALMYLILVMQFGSFTAPLAVMLSLPLSLIGVVLALLLTGGTLNLMSFIGVIMLMGLVAKNAILLLDAARVREADGMDREEALMAAGRKRLRPILMTTFALIAGMLPVAVGIGEGGEFYRPMAVAIIGGTITSTFLTLLVIPSFYDSIETSRDRMAAKFRRRSQRWPFAVAFALTFAEALLTLVFVRMLVRLVMRGGSRVFGLRRRRAQPA